MVQAGFHRDSEFEDLKFGGGGKVLKARYLL
jgi:hypothetical protein